MADADELQVVEAGLLWSVWNESLGPYASSDDLELLVGELDALFVGEGLELVCRLACAEPRLPVVVQIGVVHGILLFGTWTVHACN